MRPRLLLLVLAACALLLLAWSLQRVPVDPSRLDAAANPDAIHAATAPASPAQGDLRRNEAELGSDASAAATSVPKVASLFVAGRVRITTPGWSEPLVLMVTVSEAESTNLTCSSDGSFRVPIPSPSANVWFRVPGWFRIASVEGGKRINESVASVAGPHDDVLLELELLPYLSFHLRWEHDRTPLREQDVLLRHDWISGGSMASSMVTDEHGVARVGLDLDALENLRQLWVTVTDLPGGSDYGTRFSGELLRARHGPHEVLVRVGAPIKFFAHDPDGRAVADAVAELGTKSGTPSDASGIGQFFDSIPHASRVRFRAPGHRATWVSVPEPAPALLEVKLPRASTLAIQLVNGLDEARESYSVRLGFLRMDGASLLSEAAHEYGRPRIGRWVVGGTRNQDPVLSYESWLKFDEAGRILLDGIYTDRSAEVELIVAGAVLQRAMVHFTVDGVARELTLHGAFESCTLHGRVVDEVGAPLAGVQVWISDPEVRGTQGSISVLTDAAGRFSATGLPAHSEFAVWSEMDGRTRGEQRVRGGTSSTDLLLTSARLRRVSVNVLRADGQPHRDSDGGRIRPGPQAVLTDGQILHPEHGDEAQQWIFDSLPPGLVHIRIATQQGSAEIQHDTSQAEATLVLRP
jgi:hypothetical protein